MVDFLLLSISILPEVTQVYIQSTPVLTVKSKPVKAEINPGNKFINQINKVTSVQLKKISLNLTA